MLSCASIKKILSGFAGLAPAKPKAQALGFGFGFLFLVFLDFGF
jgi:hypothetical protein